jgi:hypothetical protein
MDRDSGVTWAEQVEFHARTGLHIPCDPSVPIVPSLCRVGQVCEARRLIKYETQRDNAGVDRPRKGLTEYNHILQKVKHLLRPMYAPPSQCVHPRKL